MQNIAICASGDNSTAMVDGRFGRCPFFMIWDTEASEFKSMKNTGIEAAHGAGTGAAQVLLQNKVGVILTTRIGPKAFQVLNSAGIKIYQGQDNMSVQALLDKYLDQQLQEIKQPNN